MPRRGGLVPAEMTAGVADVTSAYAPGHFVSSMVSGVAWAGGAIMLAGPMRRCPDRRGWDLVSTGLVVLTAVAVMTSGAVLPDGLAQRAGNAAFHAWFVLLCVKLIRLGSETTTHPLDDGRAPDFDDPPPGAIGAQRRAAGQCAARAAASAEVPSY